jgi:N-acetylglucosamine-6-phosphate deacetylase
VIVIAGGDLVLPDRVQPTSSLIIDGDRIAAIEPGRAEPSGAVLLDARDCYVLPGFIDVHVHGVLGHDTLDGHDAVDRIAAALPQYGVTAFCPTSVACPPDVLRVFLDQVRKARLARPSGSARVLPAHLESNFINPEYRGAQPAACLRLPPGADEAQHPSGSDPGNYSGREILAAISASRADVGIVTLAPELAGGIDLVRALVAEGHRVSLGHSGADFEIANAAIDAGASHATHLFNRMTSIAHRSPGLAGAIIAREEVTAELICDGYHVHPAMCGVAIAAKGPARVMAITDGTAGSGQPVGSEGRLGGRPIHVRDEAAFLDDGTLAGSTLTMDRALRNIVMTFPRSIVDAALMCATTPARQLGLVNTGRIAAGGVADLVVLDRELRVVRTLIAGEQVWVESLIPSRP